MTVQQAGLASWVGFKLSSFQAINGTDINGLINLPLFAGGHYCCCYTLLPVYCYALGSPIQYQYPTEGPKLGLALL
jgi:hypothetical protein